MAVESDLEASSSDISVTSSEDSSVDNEGLDFDNLLESEPFLQESNSAAALEISKQNNDINNININNDNKVNNGNISSSIISHSISASNSAEKPKNNHNLKQQADKIKATPKRCNSSTLISTTTKPKPVARSRPKTPVSKVALGVTPNKKKATARTKSQSDRYI